MGGQEGTRIKKRWGRNTKRATRDYHSVTGKLQRRHLSSKQSWKTSPLNFNHTVRGNGYIGPYRMVEGGSGHGANQVCHVHVEL